MRQASPCREQIAGLLDLLAEDAAFFGCEAQFDRARAIMDDGTSADRQLQIYRAARDEGVPRVEALKRVVDWQIEETRKRVDRPA